MLRRRGGFEILAEFAEEWRGLCDEVSSDPFYRPEWIESYLRAFEPDASLILISVWREGRMRAVLPLILDSTSHWGIRRLRFPGNVHSCRFDLVRCGGSEGEEAVRSIWAELKRIKDWDVLDICHTPERGGAQQLQSAAQVDGFLVHRHTEWFSLVLHIEEAPGTRQLSLPGMSQKFRANLRRTRKQLETLGQVRIVHCENADTETLSRFYELERSSWKGEQGTAIACNERTREYYDRIVESAARHGYLSLDFLELDGRAISAHLGFKLAGRYYLAKAAYDASLRRYGTGQLLVHEIVQRASEWKLKEFDFTGPATWDESRWTSSIKGLCRIYVFQDHWKSRLLQRRLTAIPRLKKLLGIEQPAVCELLSAPENVNDAVIVPEGVTLGPRPLLRRLLECVRGNRRTVKMQGR